MEQVIKINGVNYSFDIFKNLTEPCPQCGVPACGREDYFWYEKDSLRKTLVIDGATLEIILEQFFTANITKVEYQKLPKFLRESNESIGWTEADDFSGTKLDIDDLLSAIALIELHDLEDWMRDEGKSYLEELENIALTAKKNNKSLFIARS